MLLNQSSHCSVLLSQQVKYCNINCSESINRLYCIKYLIYNIKVCSKTDADRTAGCDDFLKVRLGQTDADESLLVTVTVGII